jgi:hypothetical protein
MPMVRILSDGETPVLAPPTHWPTFRERASKEAVYPFNRRRSADFEPVRFGSTPVLPCARPADADVHIAGTGA